jgi:hypothetical protein
METATSATVQLAYRDLLQLITELDARAHDLGRFADDARRHGDKRGASTHLEHRNEVLRLRESLHRCARAALGATPRAATGPGT